MRFWLPALMALSVTAPGAEQTKMTEKKLPASSLLPDGSQLHGVVVPRHNENYELVNSLMADLVTLVNDEIIAGERVTIDFFGGGGKRSARIKLREATFNQSAGMLHATENVTFDADTHRARGTGLHYALRSSRGLLMGPVTSWMQNPPKETAMKPKTPALIGAAGIALVAQTGTIAAQSQADPPKPEPVRVNTVTEGPISKARQEAEAQLKEQKAASEMTDAEVKEFVDKIPLDYEKLTGGKPTPPPTEPLEFEPGPDHTVIKCKGGMYFDADKGQLVYIKNVRVDDPQYILTGADVLRIFMKKKPEKPKTEKDNKADAGKNKPKTDKEKATDPKASDKKPSEKEGPVPSIGGNFDTVERIVANGAVRILQKAVEKGEQPVEASGAFFTYNPETGDILLSGGYPWVKQGDFFARAQQPNLTLRMKKDGSFVTEGHWEMGGRLNQNKPQNGKKKEEQKATN